MPYVTDGIHVDQVLSNLALQYRQDRRIFIADAVLPRVKVKKESDKYKIYDPKYWRSLPPTKRADGTAANQVGFEFSSDGTYSCEEYALRDIVTDRAAALQDKPIDLMADTQALLYDLILLDRERRAAALAFASSNFSGYTSALATGDRWDNYDSASSDPLEDIENAKESVIQNAGRVPNLVIMGYEVYKKVRNHPLVVERIKGGATTQIPATVGEQELARVFDVERVLVGRAVYNSANVGQSESVSFVWGKSVLVAYVDPNPGIKTYTLGFSPMVQDVMTRRWYDQERKGTWIEVGEIIDEVLAAPQCGYLYTTVVS